MKKNLLKIYDIFKYTNNIQKTESFTDINKATNKILTNKKKYRLYFKEYTKKTEVYSFKSPGITHYPLLQKKSCSLLPIHKGKIEYYEDLLENKKNPEKKDGLYLFGKSKFFSNSPGQTVYKEKMKQNLKIAKNIFRNRLLNIEKSRLEKVTNQRYNSLFLDFFYKWNKDKYDSLFNEETSKMDNNTNNNISSYTNKNYNNDDYKHIINDKYSELKYDDNLIFNSNYTNFVNERIDYIIFNNIENHNTKLESNFNDFNHNEIKLRLESIKIKFKPIRSKLGSFSVMQNKTTELQIPLYFAFLFCLKDIDFFKYIILSCITFSENEKIIFDKEKIKPSLKAFFNQKKEENVELKPIVRNSGVINTISKKTSTTFRRTVTKAGIVPRKSSVAKKGTMSNNSNSKIFNLAKNSILENNFSMNKKKKKEEIIHSNKKNNNYFYSSSYHDKNERENKLNNRKELNQYDEYIFIWETNDKTYSVNIQMPIIFFNYKNLKEEIALYCDKALFLFMYKHHFINWDFYALNYLFSIKIFRKRILQNYSLINKNIIKSILPKTSLNNENTEDNTILEYMNKTSRKINEDSSIKNDKFDLNEEIAILNKDKNKIYNMINPINESFLFFYTDKSYQNTLIKMYSYVIILDYDKLNPKIQWKYILNFKLMKLLNEISKYEPLETFLPKITKTDFQNGRLSIDFSLFHQFNINILGYEKRNIKEESTIFNYSNLKNKVSANLNKENEELSVDIKFPFFKEEKIVQENNEKILFKKTNTNLDINFLQKLNNYKMDLWPKKILEIINTRDNHRYADDNDLNNLKKKNTYENENNQEFDNYKKYTKHTSFNYSKFLNKLH